MTIKKLTEFDRNTLRFLVSAGGSYKWTNLTRQQCASGTRMQGKGLTRWVKVMPSAGSKVLHITDAGRKALETGTYEV